MLKTTLHRSYCYYPHFIDEESEAKKSWLTLIEVTQRGSDTDIPQILVSLLSLYLILRPPPSIIHTVQRSSIFVLLHI